jgi:excisionase family DNA binding protein
MKTTLENEDILAIASAVVEMIKPMFSGNSKQAANDIVFTPESLANYLQVETSWVYRQVSDKTIPYFKSGKYVRFRKAAIDKWIISHEKQPVPKFRQMRTGRVAS